MSPRRKRHGKTEVTSDDCQGGWAGKRVWQEDYVFSVDRYSVFCSDLVY